MQLILGVSFVCIYVQYNNLQFSTTESITTAYMDNKFIFVD